MSVLRGSVPPLFTNFNALLHFLELWTSSSPLSHLHLIGSFPSIWYPVISPNEIPNKNKKPLLFPLSMSLLSFTAKSECHVHNLISCHCLIDPLKSERCFPHFTEATLAKAHSGSTGQPLVLILPDLPPTSDTAPPWSTFFTWLLGHDEGERGDWKSWLKTQHSKN